MPWCSLPARRWLSSSVHRWGSRRSISAARSPTLAQAVSSRRSWSLRRPCEPRPLERAGLGEYVEVLVGDALQTLRGIDAPVGLLFLDGANDLYLAVLELLRPRLASTAIVAADMSYEDKNHEAYRAYVNDGNNGLLSTEVTLDAGLVISTPAR